MRFRVERPLNIAVGGQEKTLEHKISSDAVLQVVLAHLYYLGRVSQLCGAATDKENKAGGSAEC